MAAAWAAVALAAAFTAVVGLQASPARADPPGQASRVAKAVAPVASGPKQPATARERPPPPAVKLALEAPTTRGPWTMRVANEGAVPVLIVADARLLSLDVEPRGARAPTRCELPADMRPVGDLQRALVVPPGRSYSESFEPRLYCFGSSKLEALVPGAIVTARLGWTTGRKSEAPFEVSPMDGVQPEVAALKSIEAALIALPDEPSAWSDQPQPPRDGGARAVEADVPRLSLQGPVAVDAETPNDVEIPVTLRNDGLRAVVVRFRPESLGFDLIGPAGVERCSWPTMPGAAMREAFSTLPPHGSDVLTVTLAAYCAGTGLDRAGLLVVRPRLDTRRGSGASIGLPAFQGEVIALTPTMVRLHRGAARPERDLPLLDRQPPP